MSEKIIEVSSRTQFKNDYTRYGVYILFRRVLSDYRDGLKPVQRRVIWTMYKNTKAITSRVKSAAVVGDVMKLYHPHGDCLRGDTVLYCLNNSYITIKDAFEQGIEKLDVLAVDPNTGDVIPAVASHFRIGQYSTTEYRVHLSNGTIINCTGNHPFMLSNLTWVEAKNLIPNNRLYSDRILIHSDNGRPYIEGNPLHHIVHDYYNGIPKIGYERHHKDGDFMNNIPSNIEAITKIDHNNIHKGSINAIEGLDKGRYSMFNENGSYRDRTRAKNSILATEFNKDQGIRRFKSIINKMKDQGLEITEENYESFRESVYNLPIVSRLIERHPECGTTFKELAAYEPPTLSEMFNNRSDELNIYNQEKTDLIDPIIFYYNGRSRVYSVFNKMLLNNIPLTVENYYAFVSGAGIEVNKLKYLINLYKLECPYVEFVEVVNVPETPYYDFTVEGVENMMIPVGNTFNDAISNQIGVNIPFICIHNSSIYGTMKPLANWFESFVPLIDAEGNWGTFQGDPAAAARYTECRLSKFAIDNVLGDIMDSPEAVDWSDNYSSTTKEPDYLPVKVPLLLINGSFGIGLGMRAEIPSHNLAEVIDATLMLMDNPEADVTLIPDHCMPCEIINTDFGKISRSGFGHYRIRGKIVEETFKGKKALVIKSVPNLTFLNSITEKIEDLVKSKKIIQIEKCFDESSGNDMRYVIVLRNGADPNYVKEVLYKNTTLEQNLRINFETLNGFNPLRMSYKSYLLSFIDFRKMTKFRVYSNKLQAVQTKIHERDAYIKVLESGEIDNVIAMIKKQKTVDDTYLIEYLIKKLKITDLQANYIISADLKKLSLGYLNKYKQEAAELELIKKDLMARIMSDKAIEDDIRAELIEIKKKYGKPRNCTVISADAVSEIPKGEMIIAITDRNFIKKVPANSSLGSFKNDSIKTIIKIDNTDSILAFDEVGKVFKIPVHSIPFTDKNSNGVDVRFLNKYLTANINTVIPESVVKNLAGPGQHNNKHYLVTLSRSGLIKRMDLDDFTTVPPSGILYAKLDKEDAIKDIVIAHSNFSLVVYADRKATIMGVNDVPYLKRNTKGSKAISGVDNVDGVCVIHNNCTDIVVFTESGRVNRINVIQAMPNTKKGKSGSNLIKLGSGDRIVGVVSGNESDFIKVKCTNTDELIQIANLKIGSSISTGDKVLSTRGNKIIGCYIEKHN